MLPNSHLLMSQFCVDAVYWQAKSTLVNKQQYIYTYNLYRYDFIAIYFSPQLPTERRYWW